MKKLVFSLLAAVAPGGVFLAEAVAAFPPNDWQQPAREPYVRLNGNEDGCRCELV
jgi:hypothetical protein